MEIRVGGTYQNRNGDSISIVAAINPGEIGFDKGFRFSDRDRHTYKPDGSWSVVDKKTDRDLVKTIHE